jgi:hypothetical protein
MCRLFLFILRESDRFRANSRLKDSEIKQGKRQVYSMRGRAFKYNAMLLEGPPQLSFCYSVLATFGSPPPYMRALSLGDLPHFPPSPGDLFCACLCVGVAKASYVPSCWSWCWLPVFGAFIKMNLSTKRLVKYLVHLHRLIRLRCYLCL